MTKKYYAKELSFKNEKKTHRYVEAVEQIFKDVKELREKQAEALEKIPGIEKTLSEFTTDVRIISSESERKEMLSEKRKVQNELEELRLFQNMDIEGYKVERRKAIGSLGDEAKAEFDIYYDKANKILEELRAEFEVREKELLKAMKEDHPYLWYWRIHAGQPY